MLREDDVQQMRTDDLCHWLGEHPDLDENHREPCINVIQKNLMLGKDFLSFSITQWREEGLPFGPAAALVRIAGSVRKESKN